MGAGGKNPFDVHVGQPARRVVGLIDENMGELFVGGILSDLHDVFEKFFLGISADVHLRRLFICE